MLAAGRVSALTCRCALRAGAQKLRGVQELHRTRDAALIGAPSCICITQSRTFATKPLSRAERRQAKRQKRKQKTVELPKLEVVLKKLFMKVSVCIIDRSLPLISVHNRYIQISSLSILSNRNVTTRASNA
jgi:hypothetical protein